MSKIAIVGPAYPYRGGIADFSERLAVEFIRQGHSVVLYTFTLQYPSFLFPGKTQYSEGPAPKGLVIKREINSVNPLSWIRAGHRLRNENVDVLISAFWLPYMAPSLGTVARIACGGDHGVRSIGLVHNLVPHDRHFADKLLARYFCNSVSGFVTLSKSVLDDVVTFSPDKPRAFCQHPLYDNFGEKVSRTEACSKLGLDPSFRYLLFFGLIRDYKGLDILIDAMADSRLRRNDRLKLIVAGEFYGDGQKYFDQVNRLSLGRKIIWRNGFVPDDMVKYHFCAADLVVQPYKSATQSGITQIAYNFERPMLVTRVGGLAETVPDRVAGYVAEPSAESVAGAIAEFLSVNPDFSEGLALEKKKYSWESLTKIILSLKVHKK